MFRLICSLLLKTIVLVKTFAIKSALIFFSVYINIKLLFKSLQFTRVASSMYVCQTMKGLAWKHFTLCIVGRSLAFRAGFAQN